MPLDLPDLLAAPTKPRPIWLRVLCLAGAVIFFILGVVGWLIPIVSGIPFYVVALILLGMVNSRCRGWINRMERRLPDPWRLNLRRACGRSPRGARGDDRTGGDGESR